MITKCALLTIAFCGYSAAAAAQQCLHEAGESPEQLNRRRAALTAARSINTIQFNRPEAKHNVFLSHGELENAPFAQRMKDSKDPVVQQMSLDPQADILPGWRLTLDVTTAGYWFSVKDTTDPCGFTYISNNSGLIYTARPLR